jgi:hypothetical protein
VPRHLGLSNETTALDRVLEDEAPCLWETARSALADGDAEDAVSLVCRPLKFSACSLPHQYEYLPCRCERWRWRT